MIYALLAALAVVAFGLGYGIASMMHAIDTYEIELYKGDKQ